MTRPAPGISAEAKSFNWLVNRFADGTAGVIAAIAVSADGLLIAMSPSGTRQCRPACRDLVGNARPGQRRVGQLSTRRPDKVIIELEHGYLLVCTISVGCSLGVVASKQASLGTIAYEMAMFANRASAVLSPQVIEELKNSVGP